MPRRDPDQPRKLIISQRCARLEALHFAAACLKAQEVRYYEGDPVEEADEATGDAYDKINAELQHIARRLAKRAGVQYEDLYWDPDL
jgi:hypothetical protein